MSLISCFLMKKRDQNWGIWVKESSYIFADYEQRILIVCSTLPWSFIACCVYQCPPRLLPYRGFPISALIAILSIFSSFLCQMDVCIRYSIKFWWNWIQRRCLKGKYTHSRYFNILNKNKTEVIPMSGSRVITILRFLLWRHGGQKAIFPIYFHLKSKRSSPEIFSIIYIVEMKLGRSWDQSSNFTKIWILKISVTGSRCFWRHYVMMTSFGANRG
jgi:hypothetical protein